MSSRVERSTSVVIGVILRSESDEGPTVAGFGAGHGRSFVSFVAALLRMTTYRGTDLGPVVPGAPVVAAGSAAQLLHGPAPARLRKFVPSCTRLSRISTQPRYPCDDLSAG